MVPRLGHCSFLPILLIHHSLTVLPFYIIQFTDHEVIPAWEGVGMSGAVRGTACCKNYRAVLVGATECSGSTCRLKTLSVSCSEQ